MSSGTGNNPNNENRPIILETWKEIASYLGVSVRTVQLWEKEQGLPIHRRSGDKPRVWADVREIENWRNGKDASGTTDSASLLKGKRLWIIGFGIISILACLTILWFPYPCYPAEGTVEGSVLKIFDSRQKLCWVKEFPALLPVYSDRLEENGISGLNNRLLITDLDADENNEVLFIFRKSRFERSTLLYFDENGNIIWKFPYGKELTVQDGYGERRFNDNYQGTVVQIIEGRAGKYVFTMAHHYQRYSYQVALLNPRNGTVEDEYWHPGRLEWFHWHDLDEDGIDELFLGGRNNSGPGPGHAAMAVLKIPFSDYRPVNPETNFFGPENACEFFYALFPRIDVNHVHEKPEAVFLFSNDSLQRLKFHVGSSTFVSNIAYLDSSFHFLDFTISDIVKYRHAELVSAGVLDHSLTEDEMASMKRMLKFPTAPDGNSPEIERLFDEAPDCSETDLLPCIRSME